jgi:carotenoid cleavage dioxygenase-like enzyme
MPYHSSPRFPMGDYRGDNRHDHRSEVCIYEGNALGTDLVARLLWPAVIPHSFHGTWHSGLSA